MNRRMTMTKALMNAIKQFEAKCGKDWLKEISNLKSLDELKNMAQQWGIEFNDELAQEAYALLQDHSTDEMSEEELVAIAAGTKARIF